MSRKRFLTQNLARLLFIWGNLRRARHWLGPTPLVPAEAMTQAILDKIGYPARAGCILSDDLVRLSRAQSAHVLALVCTTSLAFGPGVPTRADADLAATALNDLAEDAHFWSNGIWDGQISHGWNPLSEATFDSGFIGYDTENAFVLWVEEED